MKTMRGNRGKFIFVFAIISVLLTGCDSSEYSKALKLYENGQYDSANELFITLNDYKDSAEMAKKCIYMKAQDSFNQKAYKEAKDLFKKLGNYEDSKNMVDACNDAIDQAKNEEDYQAAMKLFNNKEYDNAIVAFDKIKNYKDSMDYVREANYKSAVIAFEEKDYASAYSKFIKIKDYCDTPEYISLLETKYRYHLVKVGDDFAFGSFEQDGNTENGTEDLIWKILAKNENDGSILVVSKSIIKYMPYVNTYYLGTTVTWSNSDIRSWLNKSFFEEAFSEDKKEMILLSEVVASSNDKYYKVPIGQNTKDRLFLPSETDLKEYEMFFKKLFGPTKAAAKGLVQAVYDLGTIMSENDVSDSSWARTPGCETYTAITYRPFQSYNLELIINEQGALVTYIDYGVRPMMWVKLSNITE